MIRKGRPEDLERIVEMTGHFINQTNYSTLLKFMPKAVREIASRVIDHGVCLVAEEDGQVVGMLCAFLLVEPVSNQPMADELCWWVEPSARGSRSVGPRLLRSFENIARQKGAKLCKMVAPAGSDVGTFYERIGYSPVETSYIKRL